MNKVSLVLVEANDALRNSMIEYFQNCDDIELLDTASDGKEGCDKISSLKPDSVILDVVLPSIDGYAVMERASMLNKKPVFIVYSAMSTDGFVSKAVKMGADYFMIKPCEMPMLKDRLMEVYSYNQSVKQRTKKDLGLYMPETKYSAKNYYTKSLDERITNIFITVGIPPHIKGYSYLREAVKMAVDEPEIINSITKRLYPSIAGRFDTSASKVERAIRHAIEVAWNRGKMENVNSLFGIKIYSNNDKPTNGEFIALIADKMLLEGA